MAEQRYKKEKRQPAMEAEEVILKPPPPLTDAERARITETVAFVKENMPEVRDIVKDFVDAGLIHGWRNVTVKREENGN